MNYLLKVFNTKCKNTQFFIELPKIYDKLTLGNFEYSTFKNLNTVNNKTIIINLCEEKLPDINPNIIVCNLQLDDSFRQPYSYFKKIMIQCISLMHIAKNNNYSIIVNCAAGINRSCSAIVAFAISNSIPINNAINYIKTCKQNKYGNNNWPTLTNTQFVMYLKKLESDRRK
jgi:protein-tyrosine phosphatase